MIIVPTRDAQVTLDAGRVAFVINFTAKAGAYARIAHGNSAVLLQSVLAGRYSNSWI